jgi:hypothetical protein
MKVSIDGHLFDTEKAKKEYSLADWDGSNWHRGVAYLSGSGIWYIKTPSQWANMHRWEILGEGKEGARALLEEYMDYLEEDEIDEIAKDFGIDFD